VIALLLIAYLLFGVTLTESRTAWLNVICILVGLYFFWGKSRPKYFNLTLVSFSVYFFSLLYSLPAINDWIFGEAAIRRELADPLRLAIWKNLLGALMERPWLGYGWGQIMEAVFAASDYPDTGGMTKHSHNIVLDLLLYNGLVLGSLILLVLAGAFWRFWGALKQERFIIPLLAVGVVLVHAMLELPLHYAYFLLPCGMILGVLLQRSAARVVLSCPKWMGLGVALAVASGLWITIADCLEVERTYYNVYFGKKGKAIPPEMRPDVTVLTQWDDRLIFANSIPGGALSPERYRWMKGVLNSTPENFLMFQLAQNLALNGRTEEAREWQERMCKIAPSGVVQDLAEQWETAAKANAAYGMVGWQPCITRKVAGLK
jgi:hypothetical protein